jgi:hypothetical protein
MSPMRFPQLSNLFPSLKCRQTRGLPEGAVPLLAAFRETWRALCAAETFPA